MLARGLLVEQEFLLVVTRVVGMTLISLRTQVEI